MNFFLVTFLLVFVPDRQTDGRTDGQKATPKSPPCMSTGGLKKKGGGNYSVFWQNNFLLPFQMILDILYLPVIFLRRQSDIPEEAKNHTHHDFWPGDLEHWPLTLTIKPIRDIVKVNPCAKFCDRTSIGSAMRVLTNRHTHTQTALLHYVTSWRHALTSYDVTTWSHDVMWRHDITLKAKTWYLFTEIRNRENDVFLTSWPWPLTYDLDQQTRLRYYQRQSLYQISWPYVEQFGRESANKQTHTHIHTHTQTPPFL